MRKQTIFLILLTIIITTLSAGCQVFPYVATPTHAPSDLPTTAVTETVEVFTPTATPQTDNRLDNTPTPTKTAMIDPTPRKSATHELFDPDQDFLFFAPIALKQTTDFMLQNTSPLTTLNFAHPELACDWMGIAGQVFDSSGAPLLNLPIFVGGEINGDSFEAATITGMAPAYGPGGYEIQLSNQPFNSNASFWIEIYDLEGHSLTNKIFFDTFEKCEQNLILMNFVETGSPAPEPVSPESTEIPKAYP